jgi:hypothetical protein
MEIMEDEESNPEGYVESIQDEELKWRKEEGDSHGNKGDPNYDYDLVTQSKNSPKK